MKVYIGNYPSGSRWYNRLFNWYPEQTVYVHIDKWDTWSMDHTLAQIVLPMLKQLARDKHGSPMVDAEDVPFELQGDTEKHEYLIHDRWDWVMKEMIYAFDCKVNQDEVYMRFDYKLHKEEMEAEQARISNGYRLFGKYYEGLWD